MKLQGLGIIFALVVLPLILVLNYYIQLQINTITLQNEYDAKLLKSTYDAMSSFELNTANEDLSTVSDSLRTIIEASYNVFINTLSTNLGMSNASKSAVEPYIPAVLYTLYDGYYIYAPTQVPNILKDGDGNALYVGAKNVEKNGNYYRYNSAAAEDDNTSNDTTLVASDLNKTEDYGQLLYASSDGDNLYTADINNAKLETKNVLKTYMPYSARYKKSATNKEDTNFDITVVYTLDNYVSIEGNINRGGNEYEKYFTESGYLIDTTAVTIENSNNILLFNQSDAEKYLKEGNGTTTVRIQDTSFKLPDKSYQQMQDELNKVNNELEIENNSLYSLSNATTTTQEQLNEINSKIEESQNKINDLTYEMQQMDAVIYYVKAYIFSSWVHDNLMTVTEQDLIEISGQTYSTTSGLDLDSFNINFDTDNSIFETNNGVNNESVSPTEIDKDSTYYTHKLNVIRLSIQYNLNLAMSTYNNHTSYSFDYSMPIINNTEWDRILSNPSIVSFMQGYSCGLKTYSNYKIVSSINNEISVSTDNIYYINKDEFCNQTSEYHRIDCPRLIANDTGLSDDTTADLQIANKAVPNIDYIAFTSKDAKYDKISGTGDKKSTYYYDHKNMSCTKCIIDGNYTKTSNIFNVSDNPQYTNIRKAYFVGTAAIKNKLYKMNAFSNSEGYKILKDDFTTNNLVKDTSIDLKDVKSIDIVFKTIKSTDSNENSIRFRIANNSTDSRTLLNDTVYSIVPNSTKNTSIHIEVDHKLNGQSISAGTIYFDSRVNGTSSPSTSIYAYLGDADDTNNNPNYSYETKFNKIFRNSLIYMKVNYK